MRHLAPLLLALVVASPALAQEEAPPSPEAAAQAEVARGPQPFGANLFSGNYAAERENGLNPDYRILPGDRVMVNAWGAVTINDVFAVDTQGNIFLPGIGPIQLEGVASDQLTPTVEAAIRRVYRGTFGVYTNLLNASPVAVFVTGGVERPGRYAGIPSDSVLFFLAQAGGVDPGAGSFRDITVMRQGQPLAEIDLYDFLLRGTLPTPQLTDGDTILVGRRGPTVEVRGGGRGPVLVELAGETATGAQVLEVVARAARANEVTLRGVREGQPVVRTLEAATLASAPLRDGDVITFREEGRAEHIVVRLEGEFDGPAELAVRRGTRLQDLLNWVPVDPELAHMEAVHLQRERVARQQRQTIQDSLDRLERSAMLALSDTTGEAQIRVREAELVQAFVQRARNVQPLGRVVTSTAGTQLNVLLRDGDTIIIPPRTNVVRVGGEVQVAQAVMYRPDLTVREYVQMAGGYTNRAETDAVIVLRPNAEVFLAPDDTPIRPGDEILVPPRIDRKVFQNAVDLSQIIYQIAVAASVLLRI
ncbi:MAG TPA: SLBB domain-containing protein [Polyangiaceae bacterium LLY-WYZ-15_(1-7)]|nr:capsid assembly protein [Myxococcales bacterium]MBJ73857.1 capsid assembly protein [Sandaracinus sp.]HJL01799.1 SLBB domain-containing protein [Polyangiaceae bacterium LLY-WYZ-15_(1-7)]HJL09157.1 SLBB domain-containing protein [Polyangiaceae bacterium LLY-WYZ-15_(1-7)]HJL29305.1 SLBB domain-containing protein [Polyangiaceae bacterium LLY-WYZ-15_(1-7)]